jgi:hypothetical protein
MFPGLPSRFGLLWKSGAQSVEQRTEIPSVDGSPPLATIFFWL